MQGQHTFFLDYDGTLCDTKEAVVTTLKKVLAMHAGQASDAHILELMWSGGSLRQLLADLLPAQATHTPELLSVCVEQYRTLYIAEGEPLVRLFPGVTEALYALARTSRLIVVSNKGVGAVELSLEKFGLRGLFEHVIGEEPGMPRKPDPAMFHTRIAPLLGISSAKDCMMVGDTTADLLFAQNIGCKATFAAYGFGHQAECLALHPAYTLSTFNDIVRVAEDWKNSTVD